MNKHLEGAMDAIANQFNTMWIAAKRIKALKAEMARRQGA